MIVPELAVVTGIVALAAFCASYLGVAYLRRWAARRHLLDLPNARSSHTQPTPRGGGLAIVLCTLAALWLLLFLTQQPITRAVAAYTAGAILIATISWFDDIHSLSSGLRFGVHGLAALLIVLGIGSWHLVALPVIGSVPLGWLGILLTFFWIIAFTNFYNFMDGIDGLAALQAVIAGLAWLIIGLWLGSYVVLALGLLLAAASIGFLLHNWSPARIFMGDVGSATLGFIFAVLPLMAHNAEPRLAVISVVVVWPFVFDASFTLLRRLRRGENIFQAHRSHLYQRLVIAGYTHRSVTVLYGTWALISCAAAVSWLLYPSLGQWLFLLWLPGSAAGMWYFVRRVETVSGQHPAGAPSAHTPASASK